MSTHIPALSYKLFPPRSSASCESLLTTIDQLAPTNPDCAPDLPAIWQEGGWRRPCIREAQVQP